ncbi:MAG TPA: AAA domain-containing protein, partial [Chloroflexota bacterium]
MRLYGEANNVRGLATGPIETRFARLLQNTAADNLVVWTTPTRWAAGEGLSLRFPQLHLEFSCSLGEGHLVATKVAQVPEDARPPDREPGAVGVVVHPERILLPPDDAANGSSDPGVDILEAHFARLAGQRWGGFAAPLRAALEAEAREDEARTQRLTVPFKDATLSHGGEEDVWRLKGLPVDALRAFDDGEWLEVMDDQGRSRTSARVIDTHPSAGTMIVGVRAASDPPRSGFVRPRSRRKILEQKRALLEELASPTGSLPNLVHLVAAPASMPTPRQVRPERFVNAAVVRNRSQSRAVALALGLEDGQAMMIMGPPGTGKSTTAAEIDVQLILRDPGVKILVCSHSNHGTDNMLMKVLPFLEDAHERIARIGFYERVAKDARPYYATPDADLGDRNIIFTTIDALVLQDVAGARVYDYVIVDEANRAGVLDSLLALARGKRMIMVGDPMQLQPVMSEAEQQIVAASSNNGAGGRRGRPGGRPALVGVAQPGAQHVVGKSLFAWIQERRFAPAATVLLDQQNRMHPAIGELVSRVFYSSRVRTGPAAPRRGTGLPMFPSPVTWVDTRSLRGNVESRAGGTSLFNVAEARLVTSVTRYLASQAPPNLTIGVITAYAEQRDLLRRLMGPHDWPTERQLEIDTVDAFEGREKDIIVLSLVRANRRRDIGFLRLEQRLNVAISRSRRLLILVGDTSTLRGGYFNYLVATTQNVGHIVPAPKLIGQLLHRGRRPQREGLPGQGPRIDDGGLAAASAADGAGVAPVAAPGQESGLPTSARRRRRRAWERRRERLRQQSEQTPPDSDQAASASPGADGGVPGATPLEFGAEDAPSTDQSPRLRRRRRRRPDVRGTSPGAEAADALETAGEDTTEPGVPGAQSAPAAPTAPSTRRGRRRVPEPAAETPLPPAAPAAEAPVPSAEPARDRSRRKPAVPVAPSATAAPPGVPIEPQGPPAAAPGPSTRRRAATAPPGPSTRRRAAAAPVAAARVDVEPAAVM